MAKATISRQRAAATRRQRSSPWRQLRANLYDFSALFRESWFYLIIFGLLIAGCTFYFSQFARNPDGMDIGKAIYHSLQLMLFQISDDHFPQTVLGEIFFIAVPVLGVTLIFQSVVNFSRLLFDKSSRRETWQVALAETFHNHVIVCGLGRLGFRVVSQLLDSGYEVVIVTNNWNAPFVTRMLDLRVPIVVGDAREVSVLRQAGVNRAHAVIALVNDDVINLDTALTARKENANVRTVVRLFTDEMAQSLKHTLPASIGFSTSALASSTFAAATANRNLDFVMPVGEALVGVTEIVVAPASALQGDIAALEAQRSIRVVQHRDKANQILHGKQRAAVHAGDTLILAGLPAALDLARAKNDTINAIAPPTLPLQHPNEQYNTIIICGLGKVGYRVVNILRHTYPDVHLVVIHLNDPKHTRFANQIEQLEGVKVIIGDATDVSVLAGSGLQRAFALAALTSDDNINLQIGQAARSWQPSGQGHHETHLVLRVFSDVLAEKLTDLFGIHTAYSTSGLASPTLAAAAIAGDISHSFSAYNQLFADMRYEVRQQDQFVGQNIGAIQTQLEFSVLEIIHEGISFPLPSRDTVIAPGDTLTLLGPIDHFARLR